MNKMMNKKIMNVLNTQLTLLITWCLLEIDAKNFLKSHKSLRGKKKHENHENLKIVLE
jgi:hypothetical protein